MGNIDNLNTRIRQIKKSIEYHKRMIEQTMENILTKTIDKYLSSKIGLDNLYASDNYKTDYMKLELIQNMQKKVENDEELIIRKLNELFVSTFEGNESDEKSPKTKSEIFFSAVSQIEERIIDDDKDLIAIIDKVSELNKKCVDCKIMFPIQENEQNWKLRCLNCYKNKKNRKCVKCGKYFEGNKNETFNKSNNLCHRCDK
jgi:hypothetical protein